MNLPIIVKTKELISIVWDQNKYKRESFKGFKEKNINIYELIGFFFVSKVYGFWFISTVCCYSFCLFFFFLLILLSVLVFRYMGLIESWIFKCYETNIQIM